MAAERQSSMTILFLLVDASQNAPARPIHTAIYVGGVF